MTFSGTSSDCCVPTRLMSAGALCAPRFHSGAGSTLLKRLRLVSIIDRIYQALGLAMGALGFLFTFDAMSKRYARDNRLTVPTRISGGTVWQSLACAARDVSRWVSCHFEGAL